MTLQAQIKWVTNLADFKKAVEEGTGSIVAHTARVDKLTQSLGGTGLLGAANNYVAAVEKMGGVEKLTAAEKDKLNALLTKAIEKYEVLGRTAPAQMVALADATKKIEPPMTMAQKATALLQSTFGQFTTASLVSAAIQKISAGVGEFVQQGLKLPAIEGSYERLAGAIRLSSDAMLTNMRTATRGMVSDLDLMQAANKAMLLGLPVTEQSMGDLANTARVLGKAMGQDATKSFDDLITALGRSSPLILDNLGLTVKVGEANEAYAAKLGKTADALTDAEKKLAFYEAAMEAARRKTLELGEQSETLTELLSSAWTMVGNGVTRAVAAINVGLGKGLSIFKYFGDGIVLAIYPAIATVQEALAGFLQRIANLPGAAKIPGLQAAIDGLTSSSRWFRDAAAAQTQQLDALARSSSGAATAVSTTVPPMKAGAKATEDLSKQIERKNQLTQEEIRILELSDRATKNREATLRFEEAAYQATRRATEQYLKNLPTAIFQTTSYAGAVAQVSAAAATYQGNMAGATFETDKASKAWDRTYSALDDVSTILDNIPGKFAEIGSVVARTGQAIMKNLADGNIWGAIVSGATGVLQIFTRLFGSAGRDEVVKFAQTFASATDIGGFNNLHAKLLTLGAAGEQLWIKLTQGVGRNSPEQAKRVIEEINAAFAAQDAWMQRLPGLIEKYGLSWEQAGQQAKQAHLDEIARGLIQDFADLSKAGFDVTTITQGMSTAINDYVQQAMRTGTEVPSAMRPLLERMIDLGLLTDDAGNKIEDLSGITFATTLTEGFASVVDAIRELTRALTGDLGGALDELSRRRVVIPIDFETGEMPGTYPERMHSGMARVLQFPVIAHNGLAPDEFHAILQTGEAVLNRRAAAAVGAPTVAALNRGERPRGRDRDDGRMDRISAALEQLSREQAADRLFLQTALPKLMRSAGQIGRVS